MNTIIFLPWECAVNLSKNDVLLERCRYDNVVSRENAKNNATVTKLDVDIAKRGAAERLFTISNLPAYKHGTASWCSSCASSAWSRKLELFEQRLSRTTRATKGNFSREADLAGHGSVPQPNKLCPAAPSPGNHEVSVASDANFPCANEFSRMKFA